MSSEGVIHFRAEHRHAGLEPRRYDEVACQLIAWREILARTRLVGQEPGRYGGYGYGNVSGRVGPPGAPRRRRPFLISGTQTSGRECVSLGDFCVVERCDPAANRVTSHGPLLPSSESLTHGALYDLGPHIRFVFHTHSPTIWRRRRELSIPTTEARAGYGTPEIAREVERLFRETALAQTRILAMGGHQDGIVTFGGSAEEAGLVTLRYLARAYAAECRVGGLCPTAGGG